MTNNISAYNAMMLSIYTNADAEKENATLVDAYIQIASVWIKRQARKGHRHITTYIPYNLQDSFITAISAQGYSAQTDTKNPNYVLIKW